MQGMMFLKSPVDGEIKRLINIELLASAGVDPDNPNATVAFCGVAQIKIDMPFGDFLKQVEQLITDNYRVRLESDAMWHNKRMADTAEIMAAAMHDAHK